MIRVFLSRCNTRRYHKRFTLHRGLGSICFWLIFSALCIDHAYSSPDPGQPHQTRINTRASVLELKYKLSVSAGGADNILDPESVTEWVKAEFSGDSSMLQTVLEICLSKVDVSN